MIPKRLMACVDSTEEFDRYKDELAWLARTWGARLVLYHALPPRNFQIDPTSLDARHETEGIERLAESETFKGIDVSVVCEQPADGLPAGIVDAAERLDIECIVVPTHARTGIERLISGSVAESVLKSCAIPMLLMDMNEVPADPGAQAFDRIIVPVDFSEVSDRAVPHALELAGKQGCPVTLLHAVDAYVAVAPYFTAPPSFGEVHGILMDSAERMMKQVKQRHQGTAGDAVSLETKVVLSGLVEAIREEASLGSHPLVVMATAGRDSVGDHILGSRTERCARSSGCSVLTLPAAALMAEPAPDLPAQSNSEGE